ncbi:hypothetical protein B566_EDAN013836 [Ephemera danica]|nr:hypothetical protein B566_EDAN013836 [Ephemera danica]
MKATIHEVSSTAVTATAVATVTNPAASTASFAIECAASPVVAASLTAARAARAVSTTGVVIMRMPPPDQIGHFDYSKYVSPKERATRHRLEHALYGTLQKPERCRSSRIFSTSGLSIQSQLLGDAYKDAPSRPYGYLLCDFKQTTPENVRFRSNILGETEDGHPCAYVEKKRCRKRKK